jgi:uncharacterized coiled-coil protein SlyX
MNSAEELQATIASQQKTIAQLTATVAQLTAALLDAGDDDDAPDAPQYLSGRAN